MDFDDMEHYALAILKANDHAVSKLCASKYEEIMVDEFQDTNEIQNEIIDLFLTRNSSEKKMYIFKIFFISVLNFRSVPIMLLNANKSC